MKSYKGNSSIVFYKPFKDEKGLYHLASFNIDKKGELVNKTFYEINKLEKLENLIKVPDKDLLYYRHSPQDLEKSRFHVAEAPQSTRRYTTSF